MRSLAVAMTLFAVACSAEESAGPLLSRPPAGYRLDEEASGPMDAGAAEVSTAADSAAKRRLLRELGYTGGRARYWRKGEDFVSALVFEFDDPRGGRALVEFELDQLRARAGSDDPAAAGLFEVPGVKQAHGFLVQGTARRRKRPIFIQGVWMPRGDKAFLVQTGGVQPGDTSLVTSLARKQARTAR